MRIKMTSIVVITQADDKPAISFEAKPIVTIDDVMVSAIYDEVSELGANFTGGVMGSGGGSHFQTPEGTPFRVPDADWSNG